MVEDDATVLIVDDEPAYVAAYEDWLNTFYKVKTAESGEGALSELEATVDVVLLDRRMPGMSGDDVLERIREGAHDPRVAMITAVEPTLDITDMAFDEYVIKPVSRDDLRSVIESLLARADLATSTQRSYRLASKKVTLESSLDQATLEASDEYEKLCQRLETVCDRADRAIDELLDQNEPAAAYYDIES